MNEEVGSRVVLVRMKFFYEFLPTPPKGFLLKKILYSSFMGKKYVIEKKNSFVQASRLYSKRKCLNLSKFDEKMSKKVVNCECTFELETRKKL